MRHFCIFRRRSLWSVETKWFPSYDLTRVIRVHSLLSPAFSFSPSLARTFSLSRCTASTRAIRKYNCLLPVPSTYIFFIATIHIAPFETEELFFYSRKPPHRSASRVHFSRTQSTVNLPLAVGFAMWKYRTNEEHKTKKKMWTKTTLYDLYIGSENE